MEDFAALCGDARHVLGRGNELQPVPIGLRQQFPGICFAEIMVIGKLPCPCHLVTEIGEGLKKLLRPADARKGQ